MSVFSLCSAVWLYPEERVERAWLAGQWAGAVRAETVGSPNHTPTIDLRPRFSQCFRLLDFSEPPPSAPVLPTGLASDHFNGARLFETSWQVVELKDYGNLPTFLEKIKPKTRQLIHLCSGEFAIVVERTIAFLDSGIPPQAWFTLLKVAMKNVEKDGSNGGRASSCNANLGEQHDDPSQHDGIRTRSAIPGCRNATWGSSPHPQPPVQNFERWKCKQRYPQGCPSIAGRGHPAHAVARLSVVGSWEFGANPLQRQFRAAA